MKLLSSDLIALGLSAVIITSSSAFLYSDFTKKLESSGGKKVGVISFKKKVAQRKYAAQVIWESVEQKSTVYNNDSIRTSEDSEAIIKLNDGTKIELDDNSLIVLSLSDEQININFEQGSIRANRGGIAGQDVKQIQIHSKDTTVSIDKSNISLSKTDNSALNLSVSLGNVKLKTLEGEKILKKDQEAVILKNAKIAKIIEKKLKLISPVSGKRNVTPSKNIPVQFTWEKVNKMKIYFEISQSRNFKKLLTKKLVKTNNFTYRLAGGTYYWRLSGTHLKTKTKEISESRKISIIKDTPIDLIYPSNKKNFKYSTKVPLLNFQWSKNKLAANYKLQISKDKSFKTMIKSIQTLVTSIAIDSLSEGSYYWRIVSKVGIPGSNYQSRSRINNFTITKNLIVTPTNLIIPNNNIKLSYKIFKKNGLTFSWEIDNQIKKYKFYISKDKNFKKIVYKTDNTGNYLSLKKDLQPGNYYWRIKPVAKNQIYSLKRKFTILATGNIILTGPVNNTTSILKKKEKYKTTNFSWNKSSIKGKYLFELSKNKNFSPIYKRKILKNNIYKIKRLKIGKYFWRVKLVDKRKNQILISNSYLLKLEKEKIIPEKKSTEVAKEDEIKKPKIKTTLTVKTNVGKSTIYIDGKVVGTGKVTLDQKYKRRKRTKIKITALGFKDYKKTIRLRKGKHKILNIRLKKKRAERRIKWTRNINQGISSRPIYYKNILITPTDTGILGLNMMGKKLWKKSIKSGFDSIPVFHKSTMFIVSKNSYIYSINIYNGKIKWKKPTGGPLLYGSKPLIIKNKIILATSYGNIEVFSLTGKKLWSKELNGGVFSSITYDKDTMFIGTDNQEIYALQIKDGEEKWIVEVDSRMVYSSPKIHDGVLFIGCYSGSFYAITIAEGGLKWKFNATDSIFSTPSFLDNRVYFGSNDSFLYAVNLKTGKLIWKSETESNIVGEIAIANNLIYITSGKTIYAINADSGSKKWKKTFNKKIVTSVTIKENDLFIGLDNGKLVSLRSDLRKK